MSKIRRCQRKFDIHEFVVMSVLFIFHFLNCFCFFNIVVNVIEDEHAKMLEEKGEVLKKLTIEYLHQEIQELIKTNN